MIESALVCLLQLNAHSKVLSIVYDCPYVQEELLESRTESANTMDSLSSAKKDLLKYQDKVKDLNDKLYDKTQELQGLVKLLQEAEDEIAYLNDLSSKSLNAIELLENEVIDVSSFCLSRCGFL